MRRQALQQVGGARGAGEELGPETGEYWEQVSGLPRVGGHTAAGGAEGSCQAGER